MGRGEGGRIFPDVPTPDRLLPPLLGHRRGGRGALPFQEDYSLVFPEEGDPHVLVWGPGGESPGRWSRGLPSTPPPSNWVRPLCPSSASRLYLKLTENRDLNGWARTRDAKRYGGGQTPRFGLSSPRPLVLHRTVFPSPQRDRSPGSRTSGSGSVFVCRSFVQKSPFEVRDGEGPPELQPLVHPQTDGGPVPSRPPLDPRPSPRLSRRTSLSPNAWR